MPIPIPLLILAGLIASACTKLNAVILGRPVSVSVLDLVAVVLVLVLVAAVLWLVRSLVRECVRLRPVPAGRYS